MAKLMAVLCTATLMLKGEKEVFALHSVALSPDGDTIVAGTNDKKMKSWDSGTRICGRIPWQKLSASPSYAATMELKSQADNAHSNWVMTVAFSPDSRTIVSGGYDKMIKLWEAGDCSL